MKRKNRKTKRRKHGEQAWAVFAGSTVRSASGKPFEQKIIIPVTVHRRDSKQCVCRDIDGERLVVPTSEVFPTMEAAADWVRGGELIKSGTFSCGFVSTLRRNTTGLLTNYISGCNPLTVSFRHKCHALQPWQS